MASGANEVEFETPANMMPWWSKIWEGEYSIRTTRPIRRIVDIGACVGAFALWAHLEWPEASIVCYEPNPNAYDMLCRNVGSFATCINAAVDNRHTVGAQGVLAVPPNNIGSATGFYGGEAFSSEYEAHSFEVVDASEVPECDLMKLDCEGAELRILDRYLFDDVGSIRLPHAIVLEYHSQAIAKGIQGLLTNVGLGLVEAQEYSESVGIQKWRQWSL